MLQHLPYAIEIFIIRFMSKKNLIMTTEELKTKISTHFPTRRDFIKTFNTQVGFDALHETDLSRQLAGRIGLTNAWKSAYKLFFETL